MRVPVEDMTFILRSAGERTLGPAADLLRSLVARDGGDPAAQVTIVAEQPFAAAVRRTFEIGISADRPWVIGMDADVLLLGDAIERLGGLCAAADGAVFSIATLVLCRFHGGLCFRGIHCYPRRHLAAAIPLIDTTGADLRPESSVARALESSGLRAWGPPVPIGIHDHAQWLRHVYVKMRLRARRELSDGGDAALDQALAAIRARAAESTDFIVAEWGLLDGAADARASGVPAHYDWNAPYPEFTARLLQHGLSERSPMHEPAAGLAESAFAAHDYSADRRTPAWIRERLGFDRGPTHALRRMGLSAPHPAPTLAVPRAHASPHAQRPAA